MSNLVSNTMTDRLYRQLNVILFSFFPCAVRLFTLTVRDLAQHSLLGMPDFADHNTTSLPL